MGKLAAKVALVTGGTSGIGLATATLFKQEGARVIVTGRDQKGLAQTQEELGDGALVVKSDAGSLTDIAQLMDLIKDRFGALDVLVLNAGLAPARPIEAVDEAFFDEVMRVDVKGPLFTIQKALPLFRSGASVILITSILNRIGMPHGSVYGAAKAALGSLARSLSAELVGRGIRINAVSPGPVSTPVFGKMGVPPQMLDGLLAQMREKIPMHRIGEPAEIAKAVLFLASADSTYMLGEEIAVDGGMGQVQTMSG